QNQQRLRLLPSANARGSASGGGAPRALNMVTGIIGKKLGMTQVFGQDGTATPGTVIQAGPCVVVQAKAKATDGYEAVQIGLVEDRPARVRKPLAGHYKKAGVPPTRIR